MISISNYISFPFPRDDIIQVCDNQAWRRYYISRLHFYGVHSEREAIVQCIDIMCGKRSDLAGNLSFKT